MSDVVAELTEDGGRIRCVFDYSPTDVQKIKRVAGARFQPPKSGGPAWIIPKDMDSARMLRDEFGERLKLGSKVVAWGKEARNKEDVVKALQVQDDAELIHVPKFAPGLSDWFRPYQRAAVAVMARTSVILADQPGLGKTTETIGAHMERGEDSYNGSHIIVAPKTSLEVVWEAELDRWSEHPVLVMSGDDDVATRREIIDLACEWDQEGQPFYLVLNPAFIRFIADKTQEPVYKQGKKQYPKVPAYPELFQINWKSRTFDEYHKMGLSNNKTAMFEAASSLKADWTDLLSGTPMGGKPIKLWGALHQLDPTKFTSKWRWVDQWLETEDNGYGKVIHGVRYGREQAFEEHLRPYMIRRTKEEVLPELPPKDPHIVMCEMEPAQKKQYLQFAADAEIKIDEENLSAAGILAEYMRLKQFAGARQKVRNLGDGKLVVKPTFDSGKLPQIMRLLEERGITKNGEDDEGDEQVVIGSQFKGMIDMVYDYLTQEMGIPCARITGDTGQKARLEQVDEFQAGTGPRVLLISTTAGGVAITLDRASTLIVMDETWDPDDQEQLEDRIHRASRIHQVTIYYLRMKETIEEYIAEVTAGKRVTNHNILDLRRQGLKAVA